MSIGELLAVQHLYSSYRTAIVFISTKPNYYDFGVTPFLKLSVSDVTKQEDKKVGISDTQIKYLFDFIDELKDRPVDTLYVCCDAGISRSPAIAYFIASSFESITTCVRIAETYCHLNKDLLKRIQEYKNENN